MARKAGSIDTFFKQLNASHPDRSRLSDGWIGDVAHSSRTSDHNPDDAGVVYAGDFTHDPAHGVDIAVLADELVASRDPRIKYIIRNRQIYEARPGFSGSGQWVAYTGSNPHDKHLHLSTVSGIGDDPKPWNLPTLGGSAPEGEIPVAAAEDIRTQLTGSPEVGKYPGWRRWLYEFKNPDAGDENAKAWTLVDYFRHADRKAHSRLPLRTKPSEVPEDQRGNILNIEARVAQLQKDVTEFKTAVLAKLGETPDIDIDIDTDSEEPTP